MRTVKTDQTGWVPRLICLRWTHVQNEEQTKINAHTGDEEAVLVDLVCFIEAYEAQIRL